MTSIYDMTTCWCWQVVSERRADARLHK